MELTPVPQNHRGCSWLQISLEQRGFAGMGQCKEHWGGFLGIGQYKGAQAGWSWQDVTSLKQEPEYAGMGSG